MSIWTVTRLGRKGDGVVHGAEGQALAPLVLPGEVIEGQPIRGRITAPRILTPSAARVRPVCAHYRACGGCALMHASDEFTAAWKVQVVQAALAAKGIAAPAPGLHVSPLRSRRRAVLSGRRTKKGALLGFHAKASDVIVDISECHVLVPQITAALPLLRQIVMAGASRSAELSLTVIHGPAGLDVAVRGGKPMDASLFRILATLAEDADLARLDWDGEAITRRPPFLPMGRAQVLPPPGAFLQATAEGETALLTEVRAAVGDARRVLDLFCGVGTFTLPLAEQAEIHAVEGVAASIAALDSAWRSATGLRQVSTEIRDLARRPLQPDELAHFDAIVIDPPRAGAAAQVAQIAAAQTPVIALVSCDPVTFAADLSVLVAAGYKIARMSVVDQFRFSPHVEITATLSRR
ncbi:MAG: methyltransferase [Paracoccus sp. (in: a-proteobacteria)]|nr:methyltransferase [Paracoccus sp. (in: a-proteobacteria)]